MPIYPGFPIYIDDEPYYHIYVPTFNAATNKVEYHDCIRKWEVGASNFFGNFPSDLMLFAMVNALNPAWQTSVNMQKAESPPLLGSGILTLPLVKQIAVEITSGATTVDRWWGTAQVGKFGAITFLDLDGRDMMPLGFINTQKTRHQPPMEEPCSGVRYMFPPGITAKIISWSSAPSGTGAPQTPPLCYYDFVSQQDWTPVTPNNWQVPTPSDSSNWSG